MTPATVSGLRPVPRHKSGVTIQQSLTEDRAESSYVDASALLKRYVDETDSDVAEALLASDAELVTGRRTVVRCVATWRACSQVPRSLQSGDVDRSHSFSIIELDGATCELAATIAEQTGARSLDALVSAQLVG